MILFQNIFKRSVTAKSEPSEKLVPTNIKWGRSKLRDRFWRDLGRCFREEREKRRKTVQQIYRYAGMPRGMVERLELGRCQNIGQAFKLAAYYGKRIAVRLED